MDLITNFLNLGKLTWKLNIMKPALGQKSPRESSGILNILHWSCEYLYAALPIPPYLMPRGGRAEEKEKTNKITIILTYEMTELRDSLPLGQDYNRSIILVTLSQSLPELNAANDYPRDAKHQRRERRRVNTYSRATLHQKNNILKYESKETQKKRLSNYGSWAYTV